jgi:hypothetical protein
MLSPGASKKERLYFVCLVCLLVGMPPLLLCCALLTMGTGIGVAAGQNTGTSVLIGCLFLVVVCILASGVSAVMDMYTALNDERQP